MKHALGVDPGGTPLSSQSRSATGWSLWEFDDRTRLTPLAHGQVPGNQTAFIWWWQHRLPEILDGRAIDVLACERFVDDGRTRFPDTTPLKVEGALEVLHPATVFQPNTYKSHLTDEDIKRIGLWWPGQGHAMDSMRHVFANAKLGGHMPTIGWVWPPRRLEDYAPLDLAGASF